MPRIYPQNSGPGGGTGDVSDGDTGVTLGLDSASTWDEGEITLVDAAANAPTDDGNIRFDRTTERIEVGDGAATNEFLPKSELDTTYMPLRETDTMGDADHTVTTEDYVFINATFSAPRTITLPPAGNLSVGDRIEIVPGSLSTISPTNTLTIEADGIESIQNLDNFEAAANTKVVRESTPITLFTDGSNTWFMTQPNPKVPVLRVELTTAQSITQNSFTIVEFDSVVTDTHDGWDLANDKYVVPRSGFWDVRFKPSWEEDYSDATSVTGTVVMQSCLNRVGVGDIYRSLVSHNNPPGPEMTPLLSEIVQLDAGDEIAIRVRHAGSKARDLEPGDGFTVNNPSLMMQWIGP